MERLERRKRQQAARELRRLELERERNPLLAGTDLTIAKSGTGDIQTLLRKAIAEQEQMQCPARAGAPRSDYIPLPQP